MGIAGLPRPYRARKMGEKGGGKTGFAFGLRFVILFTAPPQRWLDSARCTGHLTFFPGGLTREKPRHLSRSEFGLLPDVRLLHLFYPIREWNKWVLTPA